ncbi:MAG: response regulator [Candidatus Aureabacteria bacterium]|nr:response regulator [Candidatus Auribacterota bacterium]
MDNKPIQILLVEDSNLDARILRKLLTDAKNIEVNITHVISLKEAIEILKNNNFDIVLLDFVLPDASGIEAFIWLYAQSPEIPIIVLTGLDDEQLAVKAIRKGAQDYLVKGSVDSNHLVHSIQYSIERHRLEIALKESEKKYCRIIETANDAIITADAETGFIIDANRKAEELLGIPLDNIIGMHHTGIHPKEEELFYKKLFLEQVGKGHSVVTNLNVVHSDARLIPVEISSSVSDVQGRMIVQGIYRDITERKRVDKLKDEFVSAVSHELRTPLTSIREGVSQFLDGLLGDTTEEQTQFLNIILEDIDRLQQIIDELLDISKIESGRLELKKEMVNLTELILRILPRFNGFLKKEINLRNELPEKNIKLFLDPGKITQVITNLISNAYKFTYDGGVITVKAIDGELNVTISINDTGVGINKNDLPKIFDKFVQVNRTDGPGIKGTGLGLPISKGFVEKHGGHIWAESEVGKGTTFFFTIPKLPEQVILEEYLRNKINIAASKETKMVFILAQIIEFEKVQEKIEKERLHSVIFHDIKNIVQKSLYRSSDDTVLSLHDGISVFLIGSDKQGGQTVTKRMKKAVDDYLENNNLQDIIKLKWGISIYPDEEKYASDIIEKAKSETISTDLDISKIGIMVVDDEKFLTELMKMKLQSKGYANITLAEDGQKALDIIKEKTPDLILLDMNMPVMNGYEVIGRLKTDPLTADIPVIILSGFPVDSEKLDAFEFESIPVLSKPVDDSLLFESINRLLVENA